MAIGLVCPSCNADALAQPPVPATCGGGGKEYPKALVDEANACLEEQKPFISRLFSFWLSSFNPAKAIQYMLSPMTVLGQPREAALICPACQEAATWTDDDDGVCPHCEKPFPEDLRNSANKALEGQPPVALSIAAPLAVFAVIVCSLAIPMLWLAGGNVQTGSKTLSVAETNEYFVVPLVLMDIWLAATAYGFWRNKTWTRHVTIVGLAIALALQVRPAVELGDMNMMLIPFIAAVGVGLLAFAWYFYGNRKVVAYYRTLAKVER